MSQVLAFYDVAKIKQTMPWIAGPDKRVIVFTDPNQYMKINIDKYTNSKINRGDKDWFVPNHNFSELYETHSQDYLQSCHNPNDLMTHLITREGSGLSFKLGVFFPETNELHEINSSDATKECDFWKNYLETSNGQLEMMKRNKLKDQNGRLTVTGIIVKLFSFKKLNETISDSDVANEGKKTEITKNIEEIIDGEFDKDTTIKTFLQLIVYWLLIFDNSSPMYSVFWLIRKRFSQNMLNVQKFSMIPLYKWFDQFSSTTNIEECRQSISNLTDSFVNSLMIEIMIKIKNANIDQLVSCDLQTYESAQIIQDNYTLMCDKGQKTNDTIIYKENGKCYCFNQNDMIKILKSSDQKNPYTGNKFDESFMNLQKSLLQRKSPKDKKQPNDLCQYCDQSDGLKKLGVLEVDKMGNVQEMLTYFCSQNCSDNQEENVKPFSPSVPTFLQPSTINDNSHVKSGQRADPVNSSTEIKMDNSQIQKQLKTLDEMVSKVNSFGNSQENFNMKLDEVQKQLKQKFAEINTQNTTIDRKDLQVLSEKFSKLIENMNTKITDMNTILTKTITNLSKTNNIGGDQSSTILQLKSNIIKIGETLQKLISQTNDNSKISQNMISNLSQIAKMINNNTISQSNLQREISTIQKTSKFSPNDFENIKSFFKQVFDKIQINQQTFLSDIKKTVQNIPVSTPQEYKQKLQQTLDIFKSTQKDLLEIKNLVVKNVPNDQIKPLAKFIINHVDAKLSENKEMISKINPIMLDKLSEMKKDLLAKLDNILKETNQNPPNDVIKILQTINQDNSSLINMIKEIQMRPNLDHEKIKPIIKESLNQILVPHIETLNTIAKQTSDQINQKAVVNQSSGLEQPLQNILQKMNGVLDQSNSANATTQGIHQALENMQTTMIQNNDELKKANLIQQQNALSAIETERNKILNDIKFLESQRQHLQDANLQNKPVRDVISQLSTQITPPHINRLNKEELNNLKKIVESQNNLKEEQSQIKAQQNHDETSLLENSIQQVEQLHNQNQIINNSLNAHQINDNFLSQQTPLQTDLIQTVSKQDIDTLAHIKQQENVENLKAQDNHVILTPIQNMIKDETHALAHDSINEQKNLDQELNEVFDRIEPVENEFNTIVDQTKDVDHTSMQNNDLGQTNNVYQNNDLNQNNDMETHIINNPTKNEESGSDTDLQQEILEITNMENSLKEENQNLLDNIIEETYESITEQPIDPNESQMKMDSAQTDNIDQHIDTQSTINKIESDLQHDIVDIDKDQIGQNDGITKIAQINPVQTITTINEPINEDLVETNVVLKQDQKTQPLTFEKLEVNELTEQEIQKFIEDLTRNRKSALEIFEKSNYLSFKFPLALYIKFVKINNFESTSKSSMIKFICKSLLVISRFIVRTPILLRLANESVKKLFKDESNLETTYLIDLALKLLYIDFNSTFEKSQFTDKYDDYELIKNFFISQQKALESNESRVLTVRLDIFCKWVLRQSLDNPQNAHKMKLLVNKTIVIVQERLNALLEFSTNRSLLKYAHDIKLIHNSVPSNVLTFVKIRNDSQTDESFNHRFKIELYENDQIMGLLYNDLQIPFYDTNFQTLFDLHDDGWSYPRVEMIYNSKNQTLAYHQNDTKVNIVGKVSLENNFQCTMERIILKTDEKLSENEELYKIRKIKNVYNNKYILGPFTRIFQPNSTNDQIVNQSQIYVVETIKSNKSVCLIAYGSSGSGKTSSLIKTKYTKGSHIIEEEGIAIKYCNILAETFDELRIVCKEFYKIDKGNGPSINSEKIFFKNDGSFQDRWSGSDNQSLTSFLDNELSDEKRQIHATPNNLVSSRSHVIIYIKFITKNSNNQPQLIVCDFAGVENQFQCDKEEVQESFQNLSFQNDPSAKFYDRKVLKQFLLETYHPKSKLFELLSKLHSLDSSANVSPYNKTRIKVASSFSGDLTRIRTLLDSCYQSFEPSKEISKEISNVIESYQNSKANYELFKDLKESIGQLNVSLIDGCLSQLLQFVTKTELNSTKNIKFDQENKWFKTKWLQQFLNILTTKKLSAPPQKIFVKNNTRNDNRSVGLKSFEKLEQQFNEFKKSLHKIIKFFIFQLWTIVKSQAIKSECQNRVEEGNYINSSLRDIMKLISTSVDISDTPPFVDACLTQQCNPYYNDCFGQKDPENISVINRTGGKVREAGLNTSEPIIVDMQKSLGDEPLNQIKFCVFNVINISSNRNNPPPNPYIDMTELIMELQRLEMLDQDKYGKSDLSDEFNNDQIVNTSSDNLINKYVFEIWCKKSKLLRQCFDLNWNNNLNVFIENLKSLNTDHLLNLRHMVDQISVSNATTTIGTMTFVEQMAKYGKGSTICNFQDNEYIFEEEIKALSTITQGTFESNYKLYMDWVKNLFSKQIDLI